MPIPLKTRKNGENIFCILPNELYKFSHQFPPYKMSCDKKGMHSNISCGILSYCPAH